MYTSRPLDLLDLRRIHTRISNLYPRYKKVHDVLLDDEATGGILLLLRLIHPDAYLRAIFTQDILELLQSRNHFNSLPLFKNEGFTIHKLFLFGWSFMGFILSGFIHVLKQLH